MSCEEFINITTILQRTVECTFSADFLSSVGGKGKSREGGGMEFASLREGGGEFSPCHSHAEPPYCHASGIPAQYYIVLSYELLIPFQMEI